MNREGNIERSSTDSENTNAENSATNNAAENASNGNANLDSEAIRQSIEDRLNAQREKRLDEVRGSKKTLRQKLTEIAKLARSESSQTDATDETTGSETGNSLQSAFFDALTEATKGLAEQVDDIVTEDRFMRRDRNRRSSDRDGPFGQLAGIQNRANEWFVDSVQQEAPATSIMDGSFDGPVSAGSGFSVQVLIGLSIVAGLIFWVLQRTRTEVQMQNSQTMRRQAPTNLQNREDIVQAFHDLAARCPAVMADWWTHDRAAQALVTSRPDVDDEVRQLAQLYEQARYLPQESSLTDEQLAAAKAAWLRCRKS